MSRMLLHQPVEHADIAERLCTLFGLGSEVSFSLAHGGYMSQNFRVECGGRSYFLKQYRNRISTIVHEIKLAEDYFFKNGLPVIPPIRDKFGRPAFWMNGNWYSLFPWIDGVAPMFGALTSAQIGSIGETLARFHDVGLRFEEKSYFQPLRLWNLEKFRMEYVELMEELSRRPKDPLGERIYQILEMKRRLAETTRVRPFDIPLAFDCLLHGDFIYQNVFADRTGRVTHVFDLEKTCIGPSAYEVARSLLVNCFDDGWSEVNYELGREFVRAYRSVRALPFDEFRYGVKMYMENVIHMTWIEANHVFYGDDRRPDLYERHARRIERIGADPADFCERIYGE